MVLHYVDLDEIVRAIAGLLRPQGRVFVYDLAWDTYDERAAKWLVENDPSDNDNSIVGRRREHSELHTGATIKSALSAHFVPGVVVARPYLARMLARSDLEAQERSLIDARLLPALGFWYFARRH